MYSSFCCVQYKRHNSGVYILTTRLLLQASIFFYLLHKNWIQYQVIISNNHVNRMIEAKLNMKGIKIKSIPKMSDDETFQER